MTTDKKQLRIAIYYENRLGRNDGSPLYYNNALKSLGHEVTHFCSQGIPDKSWGKFDLHLWVDWGEDALTGALPYKPTNMSSAHPSVYITSDTHLGYEYRMNKAKEFDHVFCNQIRAVEEFARDGVKAKFLPHAVEPMAYPNSPAVIPKYDVGFVGFVTFLKRAEMLDKLFKAFPNFFYGHKLFEDCAEKYRQSKIVFNTAAVDDINMRCFEATATGSFLLTEWIPTLNSVFEEDKHLVTYKDMDECIEKARYYIDRDDEREAIAKAGMEHTLANHTYQHRAKKMLEEINVNG